MDTHSDHQNEPEIPPNELMTAKPLETEELVAPGIPIVRSSTARPLSFTAFSSSSGKSQSGQKPARATDFPAQAPTAPPLPEECEDEEIDIVEGPPEPLPASSEAAPLIASEFTWLFEYGLDMDSTVLNSVERLGGSALLYGPAVLKGYQLAFGIMEFHSWRIETTLLPITKPGAEVWGVLYRIPRRLIERQEDGLSLLDKMHSPEHFEPIEVVVYEPHRKRNIACITYIASQRIRHKFYPPSQMPETLDTAYIRRLLACAKQQHLPESYLQELALQVEAKEPAVSFVPNQEHGKETAQKLPQEKPAVREQNTEPLPIMKGGRSQEATANDTYGDLTSPQSMHREGKASHLTHPSPWLIAFALYLVVLLFLTLAFSVVQALGFWNDIFTTHFAPLGTPWFVLIYGLLGGCISNILMLGRLGDAIERSSEESSSEKCRDGSCTRPVAPRNEEHTGTGRLHSIYAAHPPAFVLITWFTHPFIGVVLAAMAYLVLNSGLFTLSGAIEQHYALFSLVGAAAGVCERFLFFKRA